MHILPFLLRSHKKTDGKLEIVDLPVSSIQAPRSNTSETIKSKKKRNGNQTSWSLAVLRRTTNYWKQKRKNTDTKSNFSIVSLINKKWSTIILLQNTLEHANFRHETDSRSERTPRWSDSMSHAWQRADHCKSELQKTHVARITVRLSSSMHPTLPLSKSVRWLFSVRVDVFWRRTT